MPTAPNLFVNQLKKFDPRLSVKWDRDAQAWKLYRVGKYIFKVDRLDSRVFSRLEQADAWRHSTIIQDMDKHNDALEEEVDRKMERVSEHVADRLTQRNY